MTYPEALDYLNSFVNYEQKNKYDYAKSFRLKRMRKLTRLLGNPHKDIKSIHIAGSKGKGSTSAIVHSILKAAGYKTGLYTSPHLVSFRERIRVNDELISEDDLSRLLENVKSVIDTMKDDMPSFFEVYTAVAYMYFKEKEVDFAVYEVGLGGRLDATNVIKPLVSAITPISYEHTDKLGDTLGQIAAEKAGIIKEDSICVSAPQEKEALEAIAAACELRAAKLVLVGRDLSFEGVSADHERQIFNVRGLLNEYLKLETSLLGEHQLVNAATAIGIAEVLSFYGADIPSGAIREGLAAARWAGRLEVVSKEPLVVFDGAHNRASANALARAIRRIFRYRKLILVLGVSKDKDIKGILDELLPLADSVILTKSNVPDRALAPGVIQGLIKDKDMSITQDVENAVRTACSKAYHQDLILITGSLFVVGEARRIFEKT